MKIFWLSDMYFVNGNYDYEDLLVKRYVFCETWEKIAEDMNYELRYIHKLHGKALRELKFFP